MNQIELIHRRLAGADGLPAVLAVSWESFVLVGTIASVSAEQFPDLYPAFTFARGAAFSGRNALAFAPSVPPVSDNPGGSPSKPAGHDMQEIADALAGLASTLSKRLRESAALAADAADRAACQNAACEAEQITRLLGKEG